MNIELCSALYDLICIVLTIMNIKNKVSIVKNNINYTYNY